MLPFWFILEVWGLTLLPFWCILSVLAVLSVVQGVPLGIILGVLGYPWVPLARSRLERPPPSKASKMKLKSMRILFKNRLIFRLDLWSVSGAFLVENSVVLGTLDFQKWASRISEVLFLRNSYFFDEMRFWIDFWLILHGFWRYLGNQNGAKIDEKT